MFKKGTKLYSIFNNKCPYCQEGDFYISKNPFSIKHLGELNKKCDKCGKSYYKEPGFYFGAMYVAYALGCVFFISSWVTFRIIAPNTEIFTQVITIGIVAVIISPYFFWLSKIIWANMFMHYKLNSKNYETHS